MGDNREVYQAVGGDSRKMFAYAQKAYKQVVDKSKWEEETRKEREVYTAEMAKFGYQVAHGKKRRNT